MKALVSITSVLASIATIAAVWGLSGPRLQRPPNVQDTLPRPPLTTAQRTLRTIAWVWLALVAGLILLLLVLLVLPAIIKLFI